MLSYDDFPMFLALPTELRLKIWRSAIPEPRVVPVHYNRVSRQYTSTVPQPALLHACSESRALLLEKYTKLILNPLYDSTIFIDFSCDTIFFNTIDCSPDGDLSQDLEISPHADRILQCAIDASLWEVLRVFKWDCLSEVSKMRNLKTVALVMNKDYERGLQRREDEVLGVTGMESYTVGSEIRHVHWYVESLRWELKHGVDGQWRDGKPHVQMWLW